MVGVEKIVMETSDGSHLKESPGADIDQALVQIRSMKTQVEGAG